MLPVRVGEVSQVTELGHELVIKYGLTYIVVVRAVVSLKYNFALFIFAYFDMSPGTGK